MLHDYGCGRPQITVRGSSLAAGLHSSATSATRAAPKPPTRTSSTKAIGPASSMTPATLYRSADARGNAMPSPAYDEWLSELPEPLSPGERFVRELQSYPTGTMRVAKRKRGDDDSDDDSGVRSPHAARLASAFDPPACASPLGAAVPAAADVAPGHPMSPPARKYEMHGQEGWNTVLRPPLSHDYKRNSLPLLYESPLRRCPVLDDEWNYLVNETQKENLPPDPNSVTQQHKLQKTRHCHDDQQEQEQSSKQGPLRTMSRALSRRDRHRSFGFGANPEPDSRPATSLAFSRRLSTKFQPSQQAPATMDSHRWSFSFRPLSRASTSAGNGYAGAPQLSRAPSRLSSIFRPDPPQQLVDTPPKILGPEDTVSGDYRLQVALVGDATVGKSCLMRRFLHNQYVDREYNPTNKDLHTFLMSSDRGVPCRVEIHDCGGGQEENDISHLTRCWWDAVVICFSVGDATTLTACLSRWVADARQNAEGVPIILAGLKSDRRTPTLQLSFLQESEVVSREQAEQAAQAIGADRYVECSARNNEKVAELFKTILDTALPRVMENSKRAADRSHGTRPKSSLLYGAGRMIRGFLRSSREDRTPVASTLPTPPTTSATHADADVLMADHDDVSGRGTVNGAGTVNSNSTMSDHGMNDYGMASGGDALHGGAFNGGIEFFKSNDATRR